MIWNHTVKFEYRIHPYKKYRDIDWPKEQLRSSIQNLFNELMNRNDRAKRMEDELRRMAVILQAHGKNLLL
jgi:hypothetical protein